MMPRPSTAAWPSGRHLALTYTIPRHFGGLTKAMLQRSWNITELTGRSVPILTVDLVPDLDEVRADLVRRGLLHTPQTLRNLWEDLGQLDDAELRKLGGLDPDLPPPEPIDAPSAIADGHGGAVTVREVPDGDADVEILRPDGTLLARQRWIRSGLRPAVTPVGDAVTHTHLWGRDGSHLGGWRGTWALWRAWVTTMAGTEPTHLVVDSATVADAFAGAAIPHTSVSVVIHNNHLDDSAEPPYGALARWRRHLMEHRDGFDAIVFLTGRQRRDAEALLGPIPHAHVIPNALAGTSPVRGVRRDERRGVTLASLDGRKRLEHAVLALAETSDTTLHVHGVGPREQSLQAMIDKTGAPVRLEGHTSEPARQFAASSYSVLTSTKEGLPLVLAEAMREGCVPISYDIAYGPSDVITDGVDGFLVPPGDHRALAAAITGFIDAPRRRRRAMRRAARRRAADFAPASICARWAVALGDAATRRVGRTEHPPDADAVARDEHLAMVARFAEPRLRARLNEVRWEDSSTFHLDLTTEITVGPLPVDTDLTIERLVVELVHRPTGRRTPLATTPTGTTTSAAVDLSTLADAPDHIVLVTAHTPDALLVDTVRELVAWGPWSSSPRVEPGRPRPTLELGRGLTLGLARPAVVGEVDLGASLRLTARDLDGRPATAFELSAPSQPTQQLPAEAGAALMPADGLGAGRWRVRAEVDGRWHDVAWSDETGTVPGRSDERTRVRLTPRGYVRIDVRDDRGLLTGLDPDTAELFGTWSGQRTPKLADVRAKTDDHGGWRLALAELPVGRHRLTLDGDGPDVEVDRALQALLPVGIVIDDRRIELRRRGTRDAYEVDVTARGLHAGVIRNAGAG